MTKPPLGAGVAALSFGAQLMPMMAAAATASFGGLRRAETLTCKGRANYLKLKEIRETRRTGAHFPKFVLHLSAHLFHELRKVMGTSKLMVLVPGFYLTFLDRIRRLWCRNVK